MFPVTGHYFIPPDQVSSKIEKPMKSCETLVKRKEYYEIISKHSTVCAVSEAVTVYNFRKAAQNTSKTSAPLDFQILKCEIFLKIDLDKASNVCFIVQIQDTTRLCSKQEKSGILLMLTMISERNILKKKNKGDQRSSYKILYITTYRKNPELSLCSYIVGKRNSNAESAEEESVVTADEPNEIIMREIRSRMGRKTLFNISYSSFFQIFFLAYLMKM